MVDQRTPGGVDEHAPVPHQGEPVAVEHVVGLGDVGGVQAHDVAASEQLLQRQRLGTERGGLDRTHIRVVQQDGEVERPQQLQQPAAHTGRADDPDAAAEVAGRGGLGGARVGMGTAEVLAVVEGVLAHQQDHGERVLRDGKGVARHRAGDGDPAFPQGLADQGADRAGRVQHGVELRDRREDAGVQVRAAPAGDQHLGTGQGTGRGRIGEVPHHQPGVDVGRAPQSLHQRRREEQREVHRVHREHGPRQLRAGHDSPGAEGGERKLFLKASSTVDPPGSGGQSAGRGGRREVPVRRNALDERRSWRDGRG